MVNWTATSTGTLPEAAILGYLLEVDDGNATYVTVYNGTFKPGVLGHRVDGLQNGHFYKFRVLSVNYNGYSVPSAEAGYYVCTAPTDFSAPLVISQTQSEMVLFWEPPGDLGGCRITGYAVFRDDGAVASSSAGAGITNELNVASDPAIRDLPSLNTIAATSWPTGTEG